MERQKLTVRLPKEDLEFVKRYAAAHQLTVTEVISRYLKCLQQQHDKIHPEVKRISGLVPAHIDAKAAYHEHLLYKHQ